jgi:hypothetical protein
MTSLRLTGAGLSVVSAAFATQVFAQAAIDEPGPYSFYHPNGDVPDASRSADAIAAQTLHDDDVRELRMSVRPPKARHASSTKTF